MTSVTNEIRALAAALEANDYGEAEISYRSLVGDHGVPTPHIKIRLLKMAVDYNLLMAFFETVEDDSEMT